MTLIETFTTNQSFELKVYQTTTNKFVVHTNNVYLIKKHRFSSPIFNTVNEAIAFAQNFRVPTPEELEERAQQLLTEQQQAPVREDPNDPV